MKCIYCQKDIVQTLGKRTKKFCNDACRMRHNRTSINEQGNNEQKDFSSYEAQDLYDEIGVYSQDTWKDSPAYLELRKRLEKWDIDTLIEKGYYIPNWKKPSIKK